MKSNKTSQVSKTVNGRVSKKEIIEGVKLMEQQNINLISTSKSSQLSNIRADDEWNVIKNGKKMKISKDPEVVSEVNTVSTEEMPKKDMKGPDNQKQDAKVVPLEKSNSKKKTPNQPQAQQKSVTTSNNNAKSKKSKGKNKKKRNHLVGKQDGFEIIEPEFGTNSDDSKKADELGSEDETCAEESTENISDDYLNNEFVKTTVKDDDKCEQLNVNVLEPLKEVQEEEIIFKVLNVQASKMQDKLGDAIIDISDEDICSKTSIDIDFETIEKQEASELQIECIKIEKLAGDKEEETKSDKEVLDELSFFENHKNIAELERDLMENLKILDDGIDIKCPIINPLYDFPITSAVQKWLQDKQTESFESLFRLENFKRLGELYNDCENEDDDMSDISDSQNKSETTDSDYASDIQVKINGSPASSNAKIDTKLTSKCNNKIIVKESFCALM